MGLTIVPFVPAAWVTEGAEGEGLFRPLEANGGRAVQFISLVYFFYFN
jgi:hypothetical protein